MRRCIVLLMGLALLAGAQEKKESEQIPNTWVSKVVEVKHRDVREFYEILEALGVRQKFSSGLKVIALSGPPNMVEAAEKAIQRLDVPPATPKNVELTAYLVVGSPEAVEGAGLPPELEAVAKQLKGVFSFQSLRLLDTIVLRVRDGDDNASASALARPQAGEALPPKFHLAFRKISLAPGDRPSTVRIGRIELQAIFRIAGSIQQTGFDTGIDLREGQKVVVGKANVDGSNNAMILVLTAKVLD